MKELFAASRGSLGSRMMLFDLVNLIADANDFSTEGCWQGYEDLVPEGAKQAIERRDG